MGKRDRRTFTEEFKQEAVRLKPVGRAKLETSPGPSGEVTWERMFEEEAQHHSHGVRPSRIRVGARLPPDQRGPSLERADVVSRIRDTRDYEGKSAGSILRRSACRDQS